MEPRALPEAEIRPPGIEHWSPELHQVQKGVKNTVLQHIFMFFRYILSPDEKNKINKNRIYISNYFAICSYFLYSAYAIRIKPTIQLI